MPKIVLYQPDIAQNVGAIIRTCVAFNCELHIIEPCGFIFDLKKIRKSALDYLDHAKIIHHQSFDFFYQEQVINNSQRLVLATTKGSINYKKFIFLENDFIMFGRESCGVPDEIFQKINQRIFIPTSKNVRSLNLAISCSIIIANATNN